jgi:hypothetical protein
LYCGENLTWLDFAACDYLTREKSSPDGTRRHTSGRPDARRMLLAWRRGSLLKEEVEINAEIDAQKNRGAVGCVRADSGIVRVW